MKKRDDIGPPHPGGGERHVDVKRIRFSERIRTEMSGLLLAYDSVPNSQQDWVLGMVNPHL